MSLATNRPAASLPAGLYSFVLALLRLLGQTHLRGKNKMKRMDEITAALSGLSAELQTMGVRHLELKSILERAAPLVEELENDYGQPALLPSVPVETRAMFKRFQGLLTTQA
jgi:hypothetical protein